jgi:adenine deaminase
VGIAKGCIAGVGDFEAERTVDLEGAYLSPGFIEGHIHIESSKLIPTRFAEAVLPHGTTTVVADPHEITNVHGIEGIRFMIEEADKSLIDFFFMLPSCVPATHMETAGANLSADDLRPLLSEKRIIGIAELMNYPGAFLGDPDVLAKSALSGGKLPVDGHSPGLRGKLLGAYLAAGPGTDHECCTLEEALEKLALGMRLQIREGSTAKNLKALLPLVTAATERRCLLVSDDRRPGDLVGNGHLDENLRLAVKSGLDPVTALRMVTLNPAETYGLTDRGGIRPGWIADLTAFPDLQEFRVQQVWKSGIPVVRDGRLCGGNQGLHTFEGRRLNVPKFEDSSLQVPDQGRPIRTILAIPDQIVTGEVTVTLDSENGFLIPDATRDIAKLVVIERHTGQGRTAVAFVKGLGLKEGAIGSTVAHDSHNIIIAGCDDQSIRTALENLVEMGGGQIAVSGKDVLAVLKLPIAGLMSDQPAEEVANLEEQLIAASRRLGCSLHDPFMALSFLALPVIPKLKLTDLGLVDVEQFKIVSIYA